jgi:diguanylate cyclase (GGDEF)-like protein
MEQVAAQSQELERLAKLDGLTGLYNRRYLDEALEREFARAKRYRKPLTVAMMDIDNFKQVNDAISHHAGDEVLKIVAGILKANCRTVDLVARYGGEEFVMAFPETAVPQAAAVCERIRGAVEQFFWTRISKELQVTISIGLCDDLSLPHHEKLLSAADARMYRAKELGRNRVVWQ